MAYTYKSGDEEKFTLQPAMPHIFIGSSSEALRIARAVRHVLRDCGEITLWKEGFFTIGNTVIHRLAHSHFDYAILVVTADDLINSRGNTSFGPRDNVVFELGFFIGLLGLSRTLILRQADANLKLPSDLSGITDEWFSRPSDDSFEAAVRAIGPACDIFSAKITLSSVAVATLHPSAS